ncbi:MAG: hypothetical protein Q7W30_05080 [Coriobacteriia bacterium]|nr:hypothetical protein [Coriobacteriia bacterium]
MLGIGAPADDEAACGMPVPVQIENLRREIASRFGAGYSVVSTDLYGLQGAARHNALDAVVAGAPSPFVLIEGELVCTGVVEVGVIMDALARIG